MPRTTKPVRKRIAVWAFVLTPVLLTFSLVPTISSRGWNLSREGVAKSAKSNRDSDGQSRGEAAATLSHSLGELKFTYDKRKRFRGSAAIHSALIGQEAVDRIVGELKKQIALPFDIHVVFEECGDEDAFYDRETHEIIVCYELIDGYYYLFSHKLKARAARNEAAKGAIVSIFLHEVAHALIDGWELPITGREEDAADQFATLWLINGMADGEQMALNSARSFKLFAHLERGQKKVYSDPHSLDEQRFYDTICLIYGHRPEKYEYLIREGTLPAERAVDCEEDYARLNKSWQTLLAPHLVKRTAASLRFDTLGFLRVPGYSSSTP